jgi:hypothetical protein
MWQTMRRPAAHGCTMPRSPGRHTTLPSTTAPPRTCDICRGQGHRHRPAAASHLLPAGPAASRVSHVGRPWPVHGRDSGNIVEPCRGRRRRQSRLGTTGTCGLCHFREACRLPGLPGTGWHRCSSPAISGFRPHAGPEASAMDGADSRRRRGRLAKEKFDRCRAIRTATPSRSTSTG